MKIPSVDQASAVFSDAFQYPGRKLSPKGPPFIEDNRLAMAARPGLIRKLLPAREDDKGAFAGGCYLFDTYENAKAFRKWAEEEWVLPDGMRFLDRQQFLEPTSQLWRIVAVEDFGDVESQQNIMRFERWHLPAYPEAENLRAEWWPRIRDAAVEAGLTSAWLLADPHEYHPQLGLVTAALGAESHQGGQSTMDLSKLESMTSLGEQLADHLGGTKVFDRTSWIYMIWFPIEAGDRSPDTALWPCSPPLPGLR